MYIQILVATISVALLSLLGVFLLGRRGHLGGTNRFIIPLAIGLFLGVVFFELIPETLEAGGELGSIPIVVGFIAFYLLSHLLHTFHHHHDHDSHDGCEDKAGASMLLLGDAVHNFADGVVIASAFIVNPAVGIATTIGIALHEIPQEIAEYGVLLKAGYSKGRAAFLNLASASSIVAGALVTILFVASLKNYLWVLTGLAAGNLLYIAASDLLPDAHAESRKNKQVVASFITTLVGLVGITLLLAVTHQLFPEPEPTIERTPIASPREKAIEASRAETEAKRQSDEVPDGPLESI